jgi:hypothetical protein
LLCFPRGELGVRRIVCGGWLAGGGRMFHLPKKGAIGVPALPLHLARAGFKPGRGEGFSVGILEKKKADFSLFA